MMRRAAIEQASDTEVIPDATAIITRGLRSPNIPPSAPAEMDAAALVAAASHHRVLVLLGSVLRATGSLDQWPCEFVDAFRLAERAAIVVDCLRRVELPRVLDALAASAIGTLTFKGAALAHLYYPAPHLRARADTDLLVAAADVAALDQTLAGLGYTRQQETSGQLVSYQSHYDKQDRAGVFHAFDIHWKVSNRQAFADRFSFEELWERRIAVPALGVHAVTVSRVDAADPRAPASGGPSPGIARPPLDLRSPPAGRGNDGRGSAAPHGSGRLTRSRRHRPRRADPCL